jgi:hypothetical protein
LVFNRVYLLNDSVQRTGLAYGKSKDFVEKIQALEIEEEISTSYKGAAFSCGSKISKSKHHKIRFTCEISG